VGRGDATEGDATISTGKVTIMFRQKNQFGRKRKAVKEEKTTCSVNEKASEETPGANSFTNGGVAIMGHTTTKFVKGETFTGERQDSV